MPIVVGELAIAYYLGMLAIKTSLKNNVDLAWKYLSARNVMLKSL